MADERRIASYWPHFEREGLDEGASTAAETVRAALAARGYGVTAVGTLGYGRSFEAVREGVRVRCRVEDGPCLLICEPRPSLAQRLTGAARAALPRVLEDLVEILAGDPRFGDVRWFSSEEEARRREFATNEVSETPSEEPPPRRGATVEAEELLAEGEALVRPSLELFDAPGPDAPAAVWRADRTLEGKGGQPLRHVVSVDCRWLAEHGFALRGTVSVYAGGLEEVEVVQDETPLAELQAQGGRPLWGREARSFPPREALFAFGRRLGDAASDEALEDYDQAFFQRGPIYRSDVAAVLGGWHMTWPDSADYDLPGRLVLLTFRDAEPWYEVWMDERGELTATSYIT